MAGGGDDDGFVIRGAGFPSAAVGDVPTAASSAPVTASSMLARVLQLPREEVMHLDIEVLYQQTTDAEDLEDIWPVDTVPLELLHGLFEAFVNHMRTSLAAAVVYFETGSLKCDGKTGKDTRVIREIEFATHTLKGTAANLGAWRVSLAARDLHDPMREVGRDSKAPEKDQREVLEWLVRDRRLLSALLEECRSFVRYVENDFERDLLLPMGFTTFEALPRKAPEEFDPPDMWEEKFDEMPAAIAEYRRVKIASFEEKLGDLPDRLEKALKLPPPTKRPGIPTEETTEEKPKDDTKKAATGGGAPAPPVTTLRDDDDDDDDDFQVIGS